MTVILKNWQNLTLYLVLTCFHFLLVSLGPCTLDVEPVGRWFRAWWWHHHRNGATSEGLSLNDSGTQSDEDEDTSVEIEDDVDYLRSLDPKEWKVCDVSVIFKYFI